MTKLLCIIQTFPKWKSFLNVVSCFQESIYNRKQDTQVSYLNEILS